MSNTNDVSSRENVLYIDAEFLFDYMTGISDGESAAERAEIEIPPNRQFVVMLTMPQSAPSPRNAVKICNSFKAEGVNTPLLFCRCVGNYVLTVAEGCSEEWMHTVPGRAEELSELKLFTVYECGLNGCDLYCVYDRLEKQLERVFYAENGVNIVKTDYENTREIGQFNVAVEAILKGDTKNTEIYIDSLFRLIDCVQPPVDYVKKYLINMYADMLFQNMQHNSADLIKATAQIGTVKRLSEAKEIIMDAAKRLADMNIPENGEAYSVLVKETVHIINDNIGNEDLSLRWIAKNFLYTNVDYLGKVFKKETGRNFSHYVMEKRMEAAKKCILDGGCYKIYEVAERVGFGSNSQYFSQVFKKYTGVSPLEYREYAKTLKRQTPDVQNN